MKDAHVLVENKDVKLTNLDKVFWPEENLTKAHLIQYYGQMAPLILPFIQDRPLVMNRFPDGIHGESFYQKECPSHAPDWVSTLTVQHSEKTVNYVVANDTATLVWLANQGCIEIHAWLSKAGNVDFPDVAVLDLDPADGVDFHQVVRVALLVHKALLLLGVSSYIKTSGASGLHIFIPIAPEFPFQQVTRCMKYIAQGVVQVSPAESTVERSVEKRGGKVYIDYLQNGRGKTMAFPYSLRPRPGAPVSMPLAWEEVEGLKSPLVYTMNTIMEKQPFNEAHPWAGFWQNPNKLSAIC